MAMMCDFEAPDFYTRDIRKARKEHVCSECGKPIKHSSEYHHIKALLDGTWFTHKVCGHCYAVFKWASEEMCVALGGLYEQLASSDIATEYEFYCGRKHAMRKLTDSSLAPEAARLLLSKLDNLISEPEEDGECPKG